MAGQRGLAEKVRTGLDPENSSPRAIVKQKPHFLDELWMRKTIRQHVREFSCVMALVLCFISGVSIYKGSAVSTSFATVFAAAVIVMLGYRLPQVLHPVWKSWMTLATMIGGVMTKLILSLGWLVVVIPFALGMRIFGKRVMDLSYNIDAVSYWESRDSKLDDFKLLERQY